MFDHTSAPTPSTTPVLHVAPAPDADEHIAAMRGRDALVGDRPRSSTFSRRSARTGVHVPAIVPSAVSELALLSARRRHPTARQVA